MVVSTSVSYYSRARWRVTPAYIHMERCWPNVDKLSPCEAGCPLYVDVPNFVQAITIGDFAKALSIIREKNPLPSICGHVCWHPCEDECNRDVLDKPIAIQWLERFAAEQGNGTKPEPLKKEKEERVAVIGSGPAGLTAAYDLARKGYDVAVFEALSIPGGKPATVLPNFMLPREAIQADIDHIKALGVKIHTNVNVGKDVSISTLQRQGFNAILLACGAERSDGLKRPGSDLSGVIPALSFREESKLGKGAALKGKVWVIGGDSIAVGNMIAPAWEIEAAVREGVQIEPSLAPQEFKSENGNRVSGINFKRVIPLPPGGKGKVHRTLRGFPLVEKEGADSDYAVDADTVIDAANVFQPKRRIPEVGDILPASAGKGRRGGLQVNNDTFETNIPGVFAVGDRSGTGGHIVESMGDGRTAATSIDQYLSGQYVIPVKESRVELTIKPEQVPAYLTRKERWDIPRLLPAEAVKTFEAEELGYKSWQAALEAKRCLNCRMCGNCIFERGHVCKETGSRLLL